MYVYFIMAGKKKAIKIGVAINVQRRLKELQIGNHLPIALIAALPCDSRTHALEMERKFHRAFKNQHIRGEWFSGDVDLNKIKVDPVQWGSYCLTINQRGFKDYECL